jgi:hypothetical protein
MASLANNWLTEGLIDFEYKKYKLLAYFQEVRKHFHQSELYPSLSDLVYHYRNLLAVRDDQKLILESFPKQLTSADLEKISLVYTKLSGDDNFMKEIEDTILFAIPEFTRLLEEGKDIYQYIEENLEVSPIGISPLYNQEGYFFLYESQNSLARIYEYTITLFENADEKLRGVHVEYVDTMKKQPFYSFESIKIELIKSRKKLPNPATYLIESKVSVPLHETLLPVAKRTLVKWLYQSS